MKLVETLTATAGDGFMVIFQDVDRHLHASKAWTLLLLLLRLETLNQANSGLSTGYSYGSELRNCVGWCDAF